MREPAFWWRPGAGQFLAPAAAVYGAVAAWRMRFPGRRAAVPVICVGNLTVGGAGKTPAALEIARLLLVAHERPFFLSRGFGGRLRGPVRVSPSSHAAADVGDEPLMLAGLAPTIVARNRVAGAHAAYLGGASVIVMDDGFQNPSLVKDLAIVAVDGRRGIGNGRVIPAGPLRAPLPAQIAKADALLLVGGPGAAETVAEAARDRGIPVFHGRFEPDRKTVAALGARKVLAFAGIGDPDKFFATLAEAGIEAPRRASFPDHHRYTESEAAALLAQAAEDRLVLLTTEKDLARLAGDARLAALAARARVLPVRLVIEQWDAFREMILRAVQRRSDSGESTKRPG
jgi:tetraacyldisaccharide 4'-kinase